MQAENLAGFAELEELWDEDDEDVVVPICATFGPPEAPPQPAAVNASATTPIATPTAPARTRRDAADPARLVDPGPLTITSTPSQLV
jgi:hypothetical protein